MDSPAARSDRAPFTARSISGCFAFALVVGGSSLTPPARTYRRPSKSI